MIRKGCRIAGVAVWWAGGVLALLMMATATNPNVEHGTTLGQAAMASLTVAVLAGILGGVLLLVGHRNDR